MLPAEFHFLRPEWLLLLPAVVVAAVLLAWRRLGAGNWEPVVDPALAPHVLSSRPRRRFELRWFVFALAGVLGALALAGPAWERIEQPVYRSDQALVVVLDLSRSMDAQDIRPSRLGRARLKILELLERRASGQTALVVYSAHAFTVTPLTTDTDTIAALVNSLDTSIMPSRGSYPVAAINKANALLEQAGASAGQVLLITDGGTSPAAEAAARALRDKGYLLSVLGVGTREGAPIPRSAGGFVTDRAGRIAVPQFEEYDLRDLAAAGGGRFATLTADGRDLDYLLAAEVGIALPGDDGQATDQWREEGPWLVLLLLPLAALAFRRGWAVVVLLAIMPLANEAQASVWEDLWRTPDQQGKALLDDGNPQAAAQRFENREWQAVARYRAGDYAAAESGFAGRGDARGFYNLGNALAQQGRFEEALDAYDESLARDPDNADAEYNRELVRQALEQQRAEQQAGEQQDASETPGGDSQEGEGENDPNQQTAGNDSQSQSGDDSESAERPENDAEQEQLDALQQALEQAAREAAEQTSEQQLSPEQLAELRRQQAEEQAMEQWLRRIPNDPGGLLRRKFRYQYQRLGRDQDGNPLWPDNEVQPW